MIDILYEHPLWFARLFEALDAREVPYRRVHAASLRFTPSRSARSNSTRSASVGRSNISVLAALRTIAGSNAASRLVQRNTRIRPE